MPDEQFILSRGHGRCKQFGEIIEVEVRGYYVYRQAFEVKVNEVVAYFVTGDTQLHNFLCVNLQNKVWFWLADNILHYVEANNED